jgi:hypothetical protein
MERKKRKKVFGLLWVKRQIKVYHIKKQVLKNLKSAEKKLRPIYGEYWFEHTIHGG